jgi:hypothetical protein
MIRTIKDTSLKIILGNHELFAQFLHDFIPIATLKNVKPEDIEDLSERFLPLDQEKRDADTVKRIYLKNNRSVFVIALVEHESKVNFRTPFKLLQYICFILNQVETEMEQKENGCTTRKNFRYPPVLPIVFYDGPDAWTAEKNFRDRTALKKVFGKYIPGFEYILVDLKTYRVEDIAAFNDILSLVMLTDRIGSIDRKGGDIVRIPKDYFERIGLKIPESMSKLLRDVIKVLMRRFEFPEEEIEEITGHIKKKEYGAMFENVVERYWQLKDEGIAEGLVRGRAEEHERAYQEKLESVRTLKRMGVSPGIIVASFGFSPEEIEKL